jgi:beta-lactamase class A
VAAFADLTARTLPGDALKPGTRRLFRKLLSTGCCQPKQPLLRASSWAAKAGTGWRILNLTGCVETAGGQTVAYAYFNDQSGTEDSADMERQIGPVVKWIEANLLTLTGPG